jgi:putative endonuclease
MAEHNTIGIIGENIAKTFLMKQGFTILDQNYQIRHGELDIIAKKDNVLHFVEVKSVKVRDCNHVDSLTIRPEDNLTYAKWTKLLITLETYLKHKNIDSGVLYQVDLACVYIDTEKREGRVRLMQNIHKERN